MVLYLAQRCIMDIHKAKTILINTFCEEEKKECKEINHKKEAFDFAILGTTLAIMPAVGNISTIKSIGSTLCFGILSVELINIIKQGKLIKNVRHKTNKEEKQYVKLPNR